MGSIGVKRSQVSVPSPTTSFVVPAPAAIRRDDEEPVFRPNLLHRV